MASITTRAGKGSPLTHAEVDANFNNLNNGKLDISTAPAGSITVDSSGRLLVGTSSSVGNATFSTAEFVKGTLSEVVIGRSDQPVTQGDGIGRISFKSNAGNVWETHAEITGHLDGSSGSGDKPGRLVFSTTEDGASSPTERMRIKNNGTIQLGNGTLGLTGTLVVDPVGTGMGYPMTINNPASGSTNDVVIDIYRQGSRTGYITNTNTTTSYTSTSDYRLKENILPVTDGIARLKQLNPSRFNFIIEPEIVVDGFLAHEVQAVVPEAITGEKDEMDSDGNPVYQGIDQSKLVPLLTAALQEAIERIETLEAKVAALEASS